MKEPNNQALRAALEPCIHALELAIFAQFKGRTFPAAQPEYEEARKPVHAARDALDALTTDRHAEGRLAGLEEAAMIADGIATTAASMQAAIELAGGEAPIKNAQRETAETIATAIRTIANGGTAA